MTVNVQQVEQLNSKAKSLNSTRERMIGQQEAARTSYDRAVFAYKQKYGVELDDTNLQTEFNAVSSQLQTDFDKLNTLVLSIESGEYKNTQPAMVIPASAPAQQQQTVIPQTAAAPVAQQQAAPAVQQQASPAAQAQFGQPTAQAQFGQPTAQPEPEQPSAPPTAQLSPADLAAATEAAMTQQPPVTTATTPETVNFQATPLAQFGQTAAPAPAEAAEPAQQGDDASETPFTPSGWGAPDKALNQNFENILNNGGVKFGQ